jgi:hypothetical protein
MLRHFCRVSSKTYWIRPSVYRHDWISTRVLFHTYTRLYKEKELNMEEFTTDRIRNFSVIAHIGKL